ncbi:MAG TPA: PHB depolymerase family esterase [Euzebyales bacterium]|nr:PHB depolymerase family esterase [Euzebyales bacterium]
MPDHMREATRLTRAGRLTEATALIQRALNGQPVTSDTVPQPPVNVASRVVRTDRPTTGNHTPPDQRASAATTSTPPVSGRFVADSLTNRAGTRSYRVFVPSRGTTVALPLLVLLHGCTQDAADFAAGTRMNALAEEHGFVVAYPEQSNQANPSRCWNWFRAGDQQRGSGEPSIIADITRRVASAHNVDARRIFVAGMSAGGAMALTMAMTHPDLYAAVGVHSGVPHGAAGDLPSAFQVMKQGPGAATAQPGVGHQPTGTGRPVPAIVFHGDQDQTVNRRNGELLLRQILSVGGGADHPRLSVHEGRESGGRSYTRYVYHDTAGGVLAEGWSIHGLGHAWSGGAAVGTYTDPSGPDASAQMVRFFAEHPRRR